MKQPQDPPVLGFVLRVVPPHGERCAIELSVGSARGSRCGEHRGDDLARSRTERESADRDADPAGATKPFDELASAAASEPVARELHAWAEPLRRHVEDAAEDEERPPREERARRVAPAVVEAPADPSDPVARHGDLDDGEGGGILAEARLGRPHAVERPDVQREQIEDRST